ncbi:MAG: acetyl-CoA carboxylase biotin carboxylase subunit, partial [Candidatus Thermoplasmatota archaeon]|nr:acetyl-CoA carboxylase biotin carboxylase subunit [Candidatus Thermoplasmatota archaeon]
VIRACKEMSIQSVSVYSDVDVNSPHVSMADEAVCIGPANPSESYLNFDKIIEAAKLTSSDAIHPGYGFLSENGDFAQYVIDSGLIFIGPSPETIKVMGDKAESKKIMEEAGVPTIPGHDGELTGNIDSIAKDIGFPLMVKAAAGGGGKGMRAVYNPEDLSEAIESASNEARNSFGNDTLILERFLDKPRHIEVQILGDQKGNIVHLFERECSIQRRHQKIIEESPSSAITNKLRKEMGEAAVKAAKVTNYHSTGTVEFLYQDGEFFFLEMNTRLQVEHGVTEMVCGIDLVKWQIRIANGEELSLSQKDVKQRGHSIECRIYAEDPSRNFLPTPGHVRKLVLPIGPGIRNDVGIVEGQEVSSSYDPLLSKLVVWDSNRADAIDKMNYALGNFVVLGLITNQPFLKEIMSNKDFVKGNFDTNFISENYSEWKLDDIPIEAIAAALLSSKNSSVVNSSDVKSISSPWRQKGHWRHGL